MKREEIIESNKTYWNDHADLWFGTTALPVYGVRFPTEDDLHLFSDVAGKKMLEICCGSGHSLKYNAEKGAGELWGVDLSQKQLDNAAKLLSDSGYSAKLLCAKMEDELDVPKGYFDYVYSIYGIGWTTDLQGTFDKIASYEEWLKKVIANSSTETVDPNWVLTDTFFAVRVSDNKIVGIVDLRYQLNDFLKDFGNCGYSVRPSERRKGYATEILRQICLVARKYGLKQLQLSVEKDNVASIKTIEKNGGNYCRSFNFNNEEAYVYLIIGDCETHQARSQF